MKIYKVIKIAVNYRELAKEIFKDLDIKPLVRIENIVATVSLDQTLDLNLIERALPNVEYNPDQFPGLIFRLDSPKVTALIFKSGKMVVTGAKSTAELIRAVKKIARTLVKHGILIVGKPKIQVQNIVASANLGVEVSLEKAAFLLPNSMYEPEQFPGLIHRMDNPKVVLLIFSSGKMVITGAKEEKEVADAVVKIAKKLKPSRRGELEITDINNEYLKRGELKVILLGRGYAWLDTGTYDSLIDASIFIKTIEERQSLEIGCVEEVAYKIGYIDKRQLELLAKGINTSYGDYLLKIVGEQV